MSILQAFLSGMVLAGLLAGTAGVSWYLHGPEAVTLACMSVFSTLVAGLSGYVLRVLAVNPAVGKTSVTSSVTPNAVEQHVVETLNGHS